MNSIKTIIKWIWIVAILVFFSIYAFQKKELIFQIKSIMPVMLVLQSMVFVCFAKYLLVINMKVACEKFDIKLSFFDSFKIYSLTQLSKYVPGSIWQFVSRFLILHNRGYDRDKIKKSLLAEYMWLLASAILIAFTVELVGSFGFVIFWADKIDVNLSLPFIAFIVITLISLALYLFGRNLYCWLLELRPPLKTILIMFIMWCALSGSLWVTLEPFTDNSPSFIYILGIYCFAFSAGFLVPVAPAGLGIREAVLMTALFPYVDSDVALLLAALNRVIYSFVEVIMPLLIIVVSVRTKRDNNG
ncbi:lysylphosphatidylglycerol synthase domain-containing protein [Vibrio sp. WJH972]